MVLVGLVAAVAVVGTIGAVAGRTLHAVTHSCKTHVDVAQLKSSVDHAGTQLEK